MSSLRQAFYALADFARGVTMDQPLTWGERWERFADLDRAAWVEACRAGLDAKLPQRTGEYIGKTNFPVVRVADGYFPYSDQSTERWIKDLLALVTLVEAGKEEAKGEQPNAVWLGNDRVRIGERILVLDHPLGMLLGALIERGGAALQGELATTVKNINADEIPKHMRKLKEKLPGYVVTPGRKGKGGYSTTIRPAE